MLAQNMQFPGLDVNRLPVLSWNCAEGTINISLLLQSGIIHVWVQLTEALAQYIQFGQHLPQHCHSSKAYELWNWSPVIPKTLHFFFPNNIMLILLEGHHKRTSLFLITSCIGRNTTFSVLLTTKAKTIMSSYLSWLSEKQHSMTLLVPYFQQRLYHYHFSRAFPKSKLICFLHFNIWYTLQNPGTTREEVRVVANLPQSY